MPLDKLLLLLASVIGAAAVTIGLALQANALIHIAAITLPASLILLLLRRGSPKKHSLK